MINMAVEAQYAARHTKAKTAKSNVCSAQSVIGVMVNDSQSSSQILRFCEKLANILMPTTPAVALIKATEMPICAWGNGVGGACKLISSMEISVTSWEARRLTDGNAKTTGTLAEDVLIFLTWYYAMSSLGKYHNWANKVFRLRACGLTGSPCGRNSVAFHDEDTCCSYVALGKRGVAMMNDLYTR